MSSITSTTSAKTNPPPLFPNHKMGKMLEMELQAFPKKSITLCQQNYSTKSSERTKRKDVNAVIQPPPHLNTTVFKEVVIKSPLFMCLSVFLSVFVSGKIFI
eukprot:m.72746 g.72746  ORF g.72746 m.72746 type:complete len:102 (-) comp11754_c2_seq7:1925-2230(-)